MDSDRRKESITSTWSSTSILNHPWNPWNLENGFQHHHHLHSTPRDLMDSELAWRSGYSSSNFLYPHSFPPPFPPVSNTHSNTSSMTSMTSMSSMSSHLHLNASHLHHHRLDVNSGVNPSYSSPYLHSSLDHHHLLQQHILHHHHHQQQQPNPMYPSFYPPHHSHPISSHPITSPASSTSRLSLPPPPPTSSLDHHHLLPPPHHGLTNPLVLPPFYHGLPPPTASSGGISWPPSLSLSTPVPAVPSVPSVLIQKKEERETTTTTVRATSSPSLSVRIPVPVKVPVKPTPLIPTSCLSDIRSQPQNQVHEPLNQNHVPFQPFRTFETNQDAKPISTSRLEDDQHHCNQRIKKEKSQEESSEKENFEDKRQDEEEKRKDLVVHSSQTKCEKLRSTRLPARIESGKEEVKEACVALPLPLSLPALQHEEPGEETIDTTTRERQDGREVGRDGRDGRDGSCDANIKKKSTSLKQLKELKIPKTPRKPCKTAKKLVSKKKKKTNTKLIVNKDMKLMVNKAVGETILHRAARQGYRDVVRSCLQSGICDVNVRDNAGYTPLHECVTRGHLDIARMLLMHGADPEASAAGGIKPIHDAVECDHIEVTRLLLSFGADPTISTYGGMTTLKLSHSKSMTQLLRGYLADLNGEAGREDFRWKFSSTRTSSKRQGFNIFSSGAPEAETTSNRVEVLIEESDEPLLPTFELRLTSEKARKKTKTYVRLKDVLERLTMSRLDFESEFKVQVISDFSCRTKCKQLNLSRSFSQMPSSSGDTREREEVVVWNKRLRSKLGVTRILVK